MPVTLVSWIEQFFFTRNHKSNYQKSIQRTTASVAVICKPGRGRKNSQGQPGLHSEI